MKIHGVFDLITNLHGGSGNLLGRSGHRIAVAVFGLLTFVLLPGGATLIARPSAPGAANGELVRTLAAMRFVKSIQSAFLCEKKLRVLRKPFFSKGIITIARPRQVRFETIWPYRSCYILNGRHIDMRNESNSHWRTGSVDSQPAIGMMMRQFAAWSLGNIGKVSRKYQVSVRRATRRVPQDAPAGSPSSNHKPTRLTLELFTLRPLSGVLKEAIHEIQLGFATSAGHGAARRQAAAKPLKYIRIVAKNGDQSIFWLRRTQVNPQLKPKCFAPVGPP